MAALMEAVINWGMLAELGKSAYDLLNGTRSDYNGTDGFIESAMSDLDSFLETIELIECAIRPQDQQRLVPEARKARNTLRNIQSILAKVNRHRPTDFSKSRRMYRLSRVKPDLAALLAKLAAHQSTLVQRMSILTYARQATQLDSQRGTAYQTSIMFDIIRRQNPNSVLRAYPEWQAWPVQQSQQLDQKMSPRTSTSSVTNRPLLITDRSRTNFSDINAITAQARRYSTGAEFGAIPEQTLPSHIRFDPNPSRRFNDNSGLNANMSQRHNMGRPIVASPVHMNIPSSLQREIRSPPGRQIFNTRQWSKQPPKTARPQTAGLFATAQAPQRSHAGNTLVNRPARDVSSDSDFSSDSSSSTSSYGRSNRNRASVSSRMSIFSDGQSSQTNSPPPIIEPIPRRKDLGYPANESVPDQAEGQSPPKMSRVRAWSSSQRPRPDSTAEITVDDTMCNGLVQECRGYWFCLKCKERYDTPSEWQLTHQRTIDSSCFLNISIPCSPTNAHN